MRRCLFSCVLMLVSVWALARENPNANDWLKRGGVTFMENKGQIVDAKGSLRPDVQYTAEANGVAMFFRSGSVSYVFPKYEKNVNGEMEIRSTYRMDLEFVGANAAAKIVSDNATDERSNFYLSHTPAGVTGVRSFGKITYQNIYPNVDLVFYGAEKAMKYDFIVKPGGRPSDIKLRHVGAQASRVTRDGKLEVTTPYGKVTEDAPYVYQGAKAINSRYDLKDGVVSFNVGGYDPAQPLVIDPLVRNWATYLGGDGMDRALAVTSNCAGIVTAVGFSQQTRLVPFPTSAGIPAGYMQTTYGGGNSDAIIAQFDATTGARLRSTYYGGNGTERANAVDIDARGNVYVVGNTSSTNFPAPSTVTGRGSDDAFAIGFNPDLSRAWVNVFGGSASDQANAVWADDANVYVVGQTFSVDYVTTNPFQTSNRGGRDGFIAQLSTNNGSAIRNSYFGGQGEDVPNAITADLTHLYITGLTTSSNFPFIAAGVAQGTNAGNNDAFVMKLERNTLAASWATYYGGNTSDEGRAIFHRDNEIYISGVTTGNGFPTSAGALRSANNGASTTTDAFVVSFNDMTGARNWASLYGGAGNDEARTIAVDQFDNVYISGPTTSTDLPISNTGANGYFDNSYNGGTDAYLTRINAGGSTLGWGTYYGGDAQDVSTSTFVCENTGQLYMAGFTASGNFPTANPSQAALAGNNDVFVARFDVSGDCSLGVSVNPSTGATICASGSIVLTANPTGATGTLTYQWMNGGVAIPLATAASFTATAAGNYTVMVSEGAGCSATSAAVSVSVNNPIASISPSGNVNFCGSGRLTAAPSGAMYMWAGPGGFTSTEQNPSVTVPGTYTVSVTAAGCTTPSVASVTVAISNSVNVSITPTGNINICQGGNVLLTATNVGGATYRWLLNNVAVAGATSSTLNANLAGTYQAEVRVGECVSLSNSVTVNVQATGAAIGILPAQGDPSLTFCDDGRVTLTAQTTATNIVWTRNGTRLDGTGGTMDTRGMRTLTVTTAGTWGVAVDGSGCASATVTTTVNPNPSPALTVVRKYGLRETLTQVTLCEEDSLYAVAGPDFTYQWYDGLNPIVGETRAYYTPMFGPGYPKDAIYCIIVNRITGCRTISNRIRINGVNPRAAARITTATNATTICEGGAGIRFNANTGANLTYRWWVDTLGNTTRRRIVNTGSTAEFTVNTTARVTCVVTNEHGCERISNSIDVTLHPLPRLNVTANGATNFCLGGSTELIANVTTVAGETVTFQWRRNGSNIPLATGRTYTAVQTGSYDVVVTSDRGCVVTSTATNVSASDNPRITISSNARQNATCVGNDVLVTVDNPLAGASYRWTVNGAEVATGFAVTSYLYRATTPGTYRIQTVGTSSNGCAAEANEIVLVVSVNDAVATITPLNNTTFCEGGSTDLQANGGNGFTYEWFAIDNGRMVPLRDITSGAQITTQIARVFTEDTFAVIVTNATTCRATSQMVMTRVNPNPVTQVIVNGAATVCPGARLPILEAVTRPDRTIMPVGGLSYRWFRNSIAIPNSDSRTLQVLDFANYNVEVINNRTGCRFVTDSVFVRPITAPVAMIEATLPTEICVGQPVEFMANDEVGATYRWYMNGDLIPGVTGRMYRDTADAGDVGGFSVYVEITNTLGCTTRSQSIAGRVSANPAATVNPSGTVSFCRGGFVDLTFASGASSYLLWRNGAPTTMTQTGINANVFRITMPGTYMAQITNAAGCVTVSNMVTVNEITSNLTPAIEPLSATTVCSGDTIRLRAPVNVATSYQWIVNNVEVNNAGNPNDGKGAIYNYVPTIMMGETRNDLVVVRVTDLNNGCQFVSAPIELTVNGIPTTPMVRVRNNTPTVICPGGSVVLEMTGSVMTGSSYEWVRYDGNRPVAIASSNRMTYTVRQAGTYALRVISRSGCSSQLSNQITITTHPAPNATLTQTGTTCPGDRVFLDVPVAPNTSYTWFLDSRSLFPTMDSITRVEANAPGRYIVIVRDLLTGCQSVSNAIEVGPYRAMPEAMAAAGEDRNVCVSETYTISLSNVPAGSFIRWFRNRPAGLPTTDLSGILVNRNDVTLDQALAAPGTYSYTAIVTFDNCVVETAPITYTVYPFPQLSTTPSVSGYVCEGNTTTVSVMVDNLTGSEIVSYQWARKEQSEDELAYMDIAGANASMISVGASGDYRVTVVGLGDCATSQEVRITQLPMPMVEISNVNARTCEGTPYVFNANLTQGDGSYLYTWYRNGDVVSGETGPNLSTLVAGSYQVVATRVSNDPALMCESDFSNAVELVVNPLPNPMIAINEALRYRAIVCEDGDFRFDVTNASSEWTYNWFVDGVSVLTGNFNGMIMEDWTVGTHTAYVVATNINTGCSAPSQTMTVEVMPKYNVTISGAPRCAGEGRSATLSIALPSGLNASEFSFRWYVNGVRNLNWDNMMTVTASRPGVIMVNVLDEITGCERNTDTFTVHPNPAVNAFVQPVLFNGPRLTSGTLCLGQATTLRVNSNLAGSVQWMINGAAIAGATADTLRARPVAAGNARYTAMVTTPQGCMTTSNEVMIMVNDTPMVALRARGGVPAQTICPDGSVILEVSNPMANHTYQWWNVTAGSAPMAMGMGTTFTVIGANYAQPGEYFFAVRAVNTVTGCVGMSTERIRVTITRKPLATIAHSTGDMKCENVATSFMATITNPAAGGARPEKYQWVRTNPNLSIWTSANTTSNMLDLAVNGLMPGRYAYQLRVTDTISGCQSLTNQFFLTVHNVDSTMIAGDATRCLGATLMAGAGYVNYAWMRREANGTMTTVQSSASNTYNSMFNGVEGMYWVVTTDANGCTAPSTNMIRLNANPTSDITTSADTIVCFGTSVVLNGNMTVAGTKDSTLMYQWWYADAMGMPTMMIAGETNRVLTVTTQPQAVTYYVLQTTNAAGCSTVSDDQMVVINPLPVAMITNAAGVICQRDMLMATTEAGINYTWMRGTTVVGTGATHRAMMAGNYTVMATNPVTGCTATSDLRMVSPAPTAMDSISTAPGNQNPTFCEGGSLRLGARASGATTYQWLKNNMVIAGATMDHYIVTDVTTTPGARDMYRVLVIDNVTGCTDTSRGTSVRVNPIPRLIPEKQIVVEGAFGNGVCDGQFVTMRAVIDLAVTPEPLTYQWIRNGINIVGATQQSLRSNIVGTYRLLVINTITGCSTLTDPLTLFQLPLPDVRVSADGLDICLIAPTARTTRTLTVVAPNMTNTYKWLFNGAEIAGQTSTSLVVGRGGRYELVAVGANGCSDTSDVVTIIENPRPTATIRFNPREIICEGGSTTLEVTNHRAEWGYQWIRQDAAGMIHNIAGATSRNFVLNGVAPFIGVNQYAVIATNMNTGCVDTSDATQVIVYAYPKSELSARIRNAAGVEVDSMVMGGMTMHRICQDGTLMLNANVNVSADMKRNLVYVWSVNGAPLTSRVPTAMFTARFSNDPTSNIHNYTVTAQDTITGCVLTSNIVRVTFNPLPVIAPAMGFTTTVCPAPKDSVNLEVTSPMAGATVTYQWMRNGAMIAGANGRMLTVKWADVMGAMNDYSVAVQEQPSYPVCVSNTLSLVRSTFAFGTPAVTVTQPATCGANGTITVNVTGGAGTYVYRVTGTDINGNAVNVTSASSTIVLAPNAVGTSYLVDVRDGVTATACTLFTNVTIGIEGSKIDRFQLGTIAGADDSDDSEVRVIFRPTPNAMHVFRYRVIGSETWQQENDNLLDIGINGVPVADGATTVGVGSLSGFNYKRFLGLQNDTDYEFEIKTICNGTGIESAWHGLKANGTKADTATTVGTPAETCHMASDAYVNLVAGSDTEGDLFFWPSQLNRCYTIEWGVVMNENIAGVNYANSLQVSYAGAIPQRDTIRLTNLLTSTTYAVRITSLRDDCTACAPNSVTPEIFFFTRNRCPEVRNPLTVSGRGHANEALVQNSMYCSNIYNRTLPTTDPNFFERGNLRLTVAGQAPAANVAYQWFVRSVSAGVTTFQAAVGRGANEATYFPIYDPAFQANAGDVNYVAEYYCEITVGNCAPEASATFRVELYERPWVIVETTNALCDNSATGEVRFASAPGILTLPNRYGRENYAFQLITAGTNQVVRDWVYPTSLLGADFRFSNVKPGTYRVVMRENIDLTTNTVRPGFFCQDTTNAFTIAPAQVAVFEDVEVAGGTPITDSNEIINDANGTDIGTNSATIRWSFNSNAQGYRLAYRTSFATSTATGQIDSTRLGWRIIPFITGNNFTITDLQANSNYEVRVAIICDDAIAGVHDGTITNWSDRISFTTQAAPVAGCELPAQVRYINVRPDAGTTNRVNQTYTATVQWTPAASNPAGTCYWVIYRTENNGPKDTLRTAPGATQIDVTGLIGGTEYQVQVVALCNCNTTTRSADTPVILITTPLTKAAEAQALAEGKTVVYPNPSNGNFTVKFNSAVTGTVNVRLTNALGQVVYTNTNAVDAGTNVVPVTIDNVTTGIYNLDIVVNGVRQTTKVSIR